MPADIVASDTFARLRIGYDIEGTQSPTASIAGGETEDYAITIAAGENQPPVAEDVSVDADEARPVTVEITATDPDAACDTASINVAAFAPPRGATRRCR